MKLKPGNLYLIYIINQTIFVIIIKSNQNTCKYNNKFRKKIHIKTKYQLIRICHSFLIVEITMV